MDKLSFRQATFADALHLSLLADFSFYLHPAFLGRGIGKALLERSKDIAREAGAGKLWLDVEEQNQNAIAFYQRTGWTTTGEFDFQIGSQVFHFYRMELTL